MTLCEQQKPDDAFGFKVLFPLTGGGCRRGLGLEADCCVRGLTSVRNNQKVVMKVAVQNFPPC